MLDKNKNLLDRYRDFIKKADKLPKRSQFNELKSMLERHNVVLVGLRQVGKTTLAEQLLSDYMEKFKVNTKDNGDELVALPSSPERNFLYMNLKSFPNITGQEIIEYVSSQKFEIVFIDEIQMLDKWTSIVQAMIDLCQETRFIFTGSNAIALSEETMVNRAKIYYIHPISFIEYKELWGNDNIQMYLHFGSYPKFPKYDSPEMQYKEIVEEQIIDKVISQDFGMPLNSVKFKTLMRSIKNYIGNEVKILKLNEDTKISRKTVKDYIRIMEYGRLVTIVPKFGDKSNKPITKVYFDDKSMISYFNDYDNLGSNDIGALIENQVFNILQRKYMTSLSINSITYFRNKREREIDFVVEDAKLIVESKFINNLDPEKITIELNETISDNFKDYRKVVVTKEYKGTINGWELLPLEDIMRGDYEL